MHRAAVGEVAQQLDQKPGIEGLKRRVLEDMLAVDEQVFDARRLEGLGRVPVGEAEELEDVGGDRRALRRMMRVKTPRFAGRAGLLTCTVRQR